MKKIHSPNIHELIKMVPPAAPRFNLKEFPPLLSKSPPVPSTCNWRHYWARIYDDVFQNALVNYKKDNILLMEEHKLPDDNG